MHDRLSPGQGVARAVGAVDMASTAWQGWASPCGVAPGHGVGTGEVVGVVGQAAPLDPEPVEAQARGGKLGDDGADLPGCLAAAHTPEADQRRGAQVNARGRVALDAGQVVIQPPALHDGMNGSRGASCRRVQ